MKFKFALCSLFFTTYIFAQEPLNIQNADATLDRAIQLMTSLSPGKTYRETDIKNLVFAIVQDDKITKAEQQILKAFKENTIPFYLTNMNTRSYFKIEKPADEQGRKYIGFMLSKLATKDPNEAVGNYLYFQQYQRFFNYYVANKEKQEALNKQVENYVSYVAKNSDKPNWISFKLELKNLMNHFTLVDKTQYQQCKQLIYSMCEKVNSEHNYNIPKDNYNWILK